MKPVKILHVLNGLNNGGTEAVIMNWYRNIDTTKVQFDFLIRSNCNVFADEINKYGGKVYVTPEYPKHYFRNKKETKSFLAQHGSEYKAIHVHGNALMYVNIFNIAKKYGIGNRIYHSHSITTSNSVYRFIHKINKFRIKRLATHFLACSEAAGKWAFNGSQFNVVNNGIDISKFKFDVSKRQRIRKELKLEDSFVCGHVGRFVYAKNHDFLIDVFCEILKKKVNAKLLLVGNGELENEVKAKVNTLGISDKVLFLGSRKDVNNLMQAMDVFLLPSRYEGLGVVAVEAQASGLSVLVSDVVTREVKVTDNIYFLPINNKTLWVDEVLALPENLRKDESDSIRKSGYEIKEVAKNMENLYLNL